MASPQRIYLVAAQAAPTPPGIARLVRATHMAQALRHVAADTLRVSVASQEELVGLITAGVAVETASAATSGEESPPVEA
jgi:hypothetical protein